MAHTVCLHLPKSNKNPQIPVTMLPHSYILVEIFKKKARINAYFLFIQDLKMRMAIKALLPWTVSFLKSNKLEKQISQTFLEKKI